MSSEINRIFDSIIKEKLSPNDMEVLLDIFRATNNVWLLNKISFIFADLKYEKAKPFLLKKIFESDMYGKNGSLVFSVIDLFTIYDLDSAIKILTSQDYECRISVFDFLENLFPKLNDKQKKKALKMLYGSRQIEELKEENKTEYLESTLHFIDSAIKLLNPQIL